MWCIVVLRPVGGETWRALVEALMASEPGVVRDICISRQGLPEVIDYMRGLWDAVDQIGAEICVKSNYDWNYAEEKLQRLSSMTKKEFIAECREESETDTESKEEGLEDDEG